MFILQSVNSDSNNGALERHRTVALMNDADGICKDYFSHGFELCFDTYPYSERNYNAWFFCDLTHQYIGGFSYIVLAGPNHTGMA